MDNVHYNSRSYILMDANFKDYSEPALFKFLARPFVRGHGTK